MVRRTVSTLGCVGCLILAAACLFSSVAPALGQGTGAQITGAVTDASGAAMAGAKITLTNQATGVTRVVNSGSDGRYILIDLPDGTYSLKVEQAGFQTTEVQKIVVNIGTNVEQNVKMQVGSVQQQVTVEAEAGAIDTTQSQVAGLVTLEQINTLPLNSREFLNLALLLPGTSADASRAYYNNVQIGAGGTYWGNGFFVDGVRNTWAEQGEPRQDFPEGAVSEFEVYTVQYPANLGLSSGGFLTIATKSGTNQFHGDVFEYFRDKSLNAMNYFQKQEQAQGIPKPPFRRNQYGADLGGPIIKDRTHYFLSFERTQTSDSVTVFTNPTFYSALNGNFKKPSWRDLWLARLDQKLNDKQTVFVRYAGERELQGCQNCGGTVAANGGFNQEIPREAVAVGWTWLGSSNLVNDFRFEFARAEYELATPGKPFFTQFGQYPAQRVADVDQILNFPSLTYGSDSNSLGPEKRWEWDDDVTLTHGSHEFHFGTEYDYIPFESDGVGNVLGTYSFAKDQAFNPNNPASIAALTGATLYTQSAAPTPTNSNVNFPTSYWGAYATDTWHVFSRLSVDLGLRYDRQFGSFDENFNFAQERSEWASVYASLPALPYIDQSKRGDANNFGPRLGLTWDVTGSGKSVVRAGFGMYYNNIRTQGNSPERTNLLKPSVTIVNPSYPNPFGPGQTFQTFISTAPPNITILANNFQNPYTEQFSAGTTRQFTSTLSLSVDGVYVHSLREYQVWDVNQKGATGTGMGTGVGARFLPQWGIISSMEPTGKGKYAAMYVRLEKKFSHHLTYLVSYTLSECKDNDPTAPMFDLNNPSRNYGYCSTDRRHALISSGTYQLPLGFTVSAVWTFRTSLPFNNLETSSNYDGTTQLIPGTVRDQGNRGLNINLVNAYRATLNLPAISASQIQSSRLNEVDFRAAKRFFVKEERNLEVSVQVFNLFNTKNLLGSFTSTTSSSLNSSGQIANAASAQFGEILSAQPGAQAELAAKFTF